MTEKLDEPQAGQTRVSMVWPADLKEQVRQLVGGRGLTGFTLDAVRDKLATMQTAASNDEPDSPEPPHLNGMAKSEPAPAAEPSQGFVMDPAEVAKLPLVQRMAQARSLISEREPAARHDRCPKCEDELVNGECWTCPPNFG